MVAVAGVEDRLARDDADLVAQIAAGDIGEPVAELYRRYGGKLYRFGLQLLGDRGLAEELVQECFVRLWRTVGRFDISRGTVAAYLFVIGRSIAADLRKRPSSRPLAPAGEEQVPAGPDDADRGAQPATGRGTGQRYRRLLHGVRHKDTAVTVHPGTCQGSPRPAGSHDVADAPARSRRSDPIHVKPGKEPGPSGNYRSVAPARVEPPLCAGDRWLTVIRDALRSRPFWMLDGSGRASAAIDRAAFSLGGPLAGSSAAGQRLAGLRAGEGLATVVQESPERGALRRCPD
jgi:RNA polymerase sigma factor (sigma-70 family)